MPFEVIKKAIEVMPWVQFINAFGQTETSSTITVLGPDDHRIEGTPEERENPKMINASRVRRIARGPGTSEKEVRELIKQYNAMRKMLRQLKGRRRMLSDALQAGMRTERCQNPKDRGGRAAAC